MSIDDRQRPTLTYQEILDTDSHEVPEVLRWFSPMPPSEADVPVERYTSAEFHQLEVDKVWTKVWQMACREEDTPQVGDHLSYDVVGRSILVVRSAPDVIEALLDDVCVGTWGGVVFINMDPECEPLEDHLGDLDAHFDRWPLEDRYKKAHVAKVMDCNWKAAREAFMEAFHVVATHPQLLPSLILQIPDTHRDEFKRWADSSVAAIGQVISDDKRVAAERDIIAQQHYFASELDERRTTPRDDFLTDLINAELAPDDDVEGGPLDTAEMLSIIRQIQVAGSETTASLLADLMNQLAAHPDEWDRLKRDPSRAALIVEEGLRWASPNQGLYRIVTADTEIAGTAIPAGSTLWMMYGSADHDDRIFDDPEAFRPDRDGLNKHIAFGHGIHFCLGAALARLEAVTALTTLAAHLDTISVVEPDSLRYGGSFILRGLEHLELDVSYR